MVEKPPRSGTLTRGFRLGKLGLSLTGSYLGYQAQNLLLGESPERQRQFERASSQRVREELGTLKGAAMKLGQLLSVQNKLLPEAVTKELSGLQMQAPGMHPTLARAQFKSSLGKYPEEVFRQFDPEPFAAASLGQVHRALTRQGQAVAVKIQYPAIRAAIENDFRLLRTAMVPARMSGHLPVAILNEVERGFLEETDYLHEAKNIELFAEGFKHLEFVTVPTVFRDLTTDRVLTMSLVEGVAIDRFLEGRPPAAICHRIGDHLLELYYVQLRWLRALHADSHPGNYLFQPNGHVGLIDFGCVKRIEFDAGALVRGCVARSWRAGEREAREILALVVGADVPYARAKRLVPSLEALAGIWFPEGAAAHEPVDCGKGELVAVQADAIRKSMQDKLANPDFAFVSRAEMGLYSLLYRLKARISPRAIWKRVEGSRKDGVLKR